MAFNFDEGQFKLDDKAFQEDEAELAQYLDDGDAAGDEDLLVHADILGDAIDVGVEGAGGTGGCLGTEPGSAGQLWDDPDGRRCGCCRLQHRERHLDRRGRERPFPSGMMD